MMDLVEVHRIVVPSERGPTGPVLFKGALIEKTV